MTNTEVRSLLINLLEECKGDLLSDCEYNCLRGMGATNCIEQLLQHVNGNINYFIDTVKNIKIDLEELINKTEDQNDFIILSSAKSTCNKVLIRIKDHQLKQMI